MSDNETAADAPAQRHPNPDLKTLDKLVGTWSVTGEANGTVTYEWTEGGFFLLQRVDLVQFGDSRDPAGGTSPAA